jgi:hypothetical protein
MSHQQKHGVFKEKVAEKGRFTILVLKVFFLRPRLG